MKALGTLSGHPQTRLALEASQQSDRSTDSGSGLLGSVLTPVCPWTRVSVAMLISCGCHKKLYQPESFKKPEMYSLPVQEAISLKSRCRQGRLVPAGGSEGESGVPCLSPSLWWWPPVSRAPRLVGASLSSLPPTSRGPFSVSLCVVSL